MRHDDVLFYPECHKDIVEMKPDVKVKVPPDIDTDKEEFLAIRSFSLGWEDFVFELNLGIPISFESKR